jgi:hypothetical protein
MISLVAGREQGSFRLNVQYLQLNKYSIILEMAPRDQTDSEILTSVQLKTTSRRQTNDWSARSANSTDSRSRELTRITLFIREESTYGHVTEGVSDWPEVE